MITHPDVIGTSRKRGSSEVDNIYTLIVLSFGTSLGVLFYLWVLFHFIQEGRRRKSPKRVRVGSTLPLRYSAIRLAAAPRPSMVKWLLRLPIFQCLRSQGGLDNHSCCVPAGWARESNSVRNYSPSVSSFNEEIFLHE